MSRTEMPPTKYALALGVVVRTKAVCLPIRQPESSKKNIGVVFFVANYPSTITVSLIAALLMRHNALGKIECENDRRKKSVSLASTFPVDGFAVLSSAEESGVSGTVARGPLSQHANPPPPPLGLVEP